MAWQAVATVCLLCWQSSADAQTTPGGTANNTSYGDMQFPGKLYGQATAVPNQGSQVDSVLFEIGDYGGPGGAFRPLGGLNSSAGVLQPGGMNVYKTTFAGQTAGNKPVRMTVKWRPAGQVGPVTETQTIVSVTVR
jgi:hypothetical protein